MNKRQSNTSRTTGRKLALFTLVLAFFVIALGAYTRLTHAGLGCPDWPGCYGRLTVPLEPHHVAQANATYPDRPVEAPKAWAEMIHRYLAGALGLCIFGLTYLHFKHRSRYRKLTAIMSLIVIGQAALGMWTVTLGLKPVIVMLHLMGGFTVFCLLLSLNIFQRRESINSNNLLSATKQSRRSFLLASFVVLALQIALGGWTAANYSASICTELPFCQGDWVQHLNFPEALKFWGHGVEPYRDGTSAYEYGTHLTPDVKITIHVMHRFGAIVATVFLLISTVLLWRSEKKLALGLFTLLAVQIGLGISNVVFQVPLFVAVAHNLVAVLLLGWHLMILLHLFNPGALTTTTGSQKHEFGTLQNRPRPATNTAVRAHV